MGIKHNEKVDLLDKEGFIRGEMWNNSLTYNKVIAAHISDYENIDKQYLMSNSRSVDAYYLLK